MVTTLQLSSETIRASVLLGAMTHLTLGDDIITHRMNGQSHRAYRLRPQGEKVLRLLWKQEKKRLHDLWIEMCTGAPLNLDKSFLNWPRFFIGALVSQRIENVHHR
jgi:hypothetical protein